MCDPSSFTIRPRRRHRNVASCARLRVYDETVDACGSEKIAGFFRVRLAAGNARPKIELRIRRAETGAENGPRLSGMFLRNYADASTVVAERRTGKGGR